MLIEDICAVRSSKEETSYIAVSIADRYLQSIAAVGQEAPCMIILAVICSLLASKLEDHSRPSFDNLI